MRYLNFFKTSYVSVIVFLGLFVSSCAGPALKPIKPFNVPIPENSKISFNFNAEGGFFIADQNGEAVPAKPIPFAVLVERAKKTDRDWMSILGSFTLYKIKDDSKVWICDEEYQCGEGSVEEDGGGVTFSLNYDGKRLFFGDSQGAELTEKDLKSFVSLIEETNFKKPLGIETLSMFTVYRIKGSVKISICPPSNICYCTCVWPNMTTTCCDVRGECP